mmetsp:Transcript_24752/g.46215  ORF Transcript_24752/g.46215 Transcript_24752/m.46215 type:complete len:101 (+) Transcript_24752:644-946(+)
MASVLNVLFQAGALGSQLEPSRAPPSSSSSSSLSLPFHVATGNDLRPSTTSTATLVSYSSAASSTGSETDTDIGNVTSSVSHANRSDLGERTIKDRLTKR